MLVVKKLPFEEVNVDLGNKPTHFIETYAAITIDMESRAKAPILEVGSVGEPGHVKLIESDVVARYIEDAFPDPPMQPQDPARRALGNLFVSTFMELVEPGYSACLFAKSQARVDEGFEKVRRGLFALERGLEKHRAGAGPFFHPSFSMVEALCSPFVVRMILNLKHHRGTDVLACQEFPLTTLWMRGICDHPAVVETCPADKSLLKIPPFAMPFFKATVSPEARASRPTSSEASEAAFAAAIDQGLVQQGKSARNRSKL